MIVIDHSFNYQSNYLYFFPKVILSYTMGKIVLTSYIWSTLWLLSFKIRKINHHYHIVLFFQAWIHNKKLKHFEYLCLLPVLPSEGLKFHYKINYPFSLMDLYSIHLYNLVVMDFIQTKLTSKSYNLLYFGIIFPLNLVKQYCASPNTYNLPFGYVKL